MDDKASRIILAQGLPDDGIAPAFLNAEGIPTVVMPNQLRLAQETLGLFSPKAQRIWFPSRPVIPATGLRGVVNLCADPWGYKKALTSLQEWCGNKVPVFNHPAALARTNDSNFLASLGRISGLEVPRRASFVARRPDDFRNVTQKADLRYPVRLQEAGQRGTEGIVLVKSANGWGKALDQQWPGKAFVLTEVTPALTQAHRRLRIAFAGTEAEVAGYLFHYSKGIAANTSVAQSAKITEADMRIFGAIHSAVGLDHWTVEFSYCDDGVLRLEHLWAGLPDPLPSAENDPSLVLTRKIAPKLHVLLQQPARWRAAATAKGSKT